MTPVRPLSVSPILLPVFINTSGKQNKIVSGKGCTIFVDIVFAYSHVLYHMKYA